MKPMASNLTHEKKTKKDMDIIDQYDRSLTMKATTTSTAAETRTTTQVVIDTMVATLTKLGWPPERIARAVRDFQAEVGKH
jgi:Holliday junction resolvasome RuvABC DNA-binding subunit